MKRILINISNHPHSAWSAEQKERWAKIIDLPFPSISPKANSSTIQKIVEEYKDKVDEIVMKNTGKFAVMLQGEFTFVCLWMQTYRDDYYYAVPTTERVVVEKDGVKTSIFKFVKWRII